MSDLFPLPRKPNSKACAPGKFCNVEKTYKVKVHMHV